MKIYFQNSVLGSDAFADFIASNKKSSASRLLVYVGGSNSKKTYEESRQRDRRDLTEHITAVREITRHDFAAVILPCHYSLRLGREAGYISFSTHFFCEVLPKLSIGPSCYAFVGFSSGAHLALLLARATRKASAFACMGGVGMSEALDMPIGAAAGLECPIKIFAGTEDPCLPHSESFGELLSKRGCNYDLILKTADHVFQDYEDNGSVREAFLFVASQLISERDQ